MKRPDISLVFGLPLSEAEFISRLSSAGTSARSDYLAKFDAPGLDPGARTAAQREAWRAAVGPAVGAPLAELADKAEALGFDVRRGATLSDLRQSAQADGVLVVVSHWKGPEFSNDDFAPDLESNLSARLEGRDDPLAQWLLRATDARRRTLFLRRNPLSARQALRECLAANLGPAATGGADRYLELPQTRAAKRRDTLDEWLAGCIQPGNRLELWDGLHAKSEIGQALSAFEGVLDLTVCTSTYLGDYLGVRSRQRFRTVQFLNAQEPMEAALRLRAVLQLMASGGWDYLEARATVDAQLRRLVTAGTQNGKPRCLD